MVTETTKRINCLEIPFTMEEIKDTVWSCGQDKAPRPDGLTFNFIRKYLEKISTDFYNFVIHLKDMVKSLKATILHS